MVSYGSLLMEQLVLLNHSKVAVFQGELTETAVVIQLSTSVVEVELLLLMKKMRLMTRRRNTSVQTMKRGNKMRMMMQM